MAIFKTGGKLVYFSHVPKCGGTAVEHYLNQRFGAVAFLDWSYYDLPADRRWNRTSPQHVTAETLARLFPPGFFDVSFAIVRHPVERLISEYHYLRDREQKIPATQDFSDWLNSIPSLLATDRWAADNHLRPMCDFIPHGATCFRLEDGLDRVVRFLDRITGDTSGPRSIEPHLQRDQTVTKAIPTAKDLDLIAQLYARDFLALGYAKMGGRAPARPKTGRERPEAPSPKWSRASVLQEAMWLSPHAAAVPATHNLLWSIRFDGTCDAGRITGALNLLISRHSILRAVFRWERDHVEWIARPFSIRNLAIEPSSFDRSAFGLEPYDLAQGPLFRFRLVRVDNGSLELLCGFHHLVIDGTSWPKFVTELTDILSGNMAAVPATDFGTHVSWQKGWIDSAESEPSRAYWRRRLQSLPAAWQLQGVSREQEEGGPEHRAEEFVLDGRLSGSLRQAAEQFESSPFRIAMTVFAALLALVARRDDVVLGTTLAGRSKTMANSMQGPQVNTGFICSVLTERTTFMELLHDMTVQLEEAVTHQEFPLRQAMRNGLSGPTGSHAPMTCPTFTRMPRPTHAKSANFTASEQRIFLPVGSRDLGVYFQPELDAFRLVWIYGRQTLNRQTVLQLESQFERLLQAAIDHPERPLRDLDVLTAGERKNILETWNQTDISFPTLAPVHKMVEAQVVRTPEAIAVATPERSWTYREINGAANRIATLLRDQGVAKGDFVLLQLHPSAALIAAELAVMKCGAAFVPVAPEWPENRIAQISARLGPSVPILGDVDGGGRISLADSMFGHGDPGPPDVPVLIDDPIYCIFTSGSTGRPKGAVNCHRGIANRLLAMGNLFGHAADDTVLATAPSTTDTHVWQSFWPLSCGGRVEVAPRPDMVTPASLCRLIKSRAVSVADFVPTVFTGLVDHLAQHGATDLATLRLLLIGGEAMKATDTYRFRSLLPDCRIVNTYGPTEASIGSVFHDLPVEYTDPVPIGRPIANTRAVILDGTRLTPPGMTGELCLGGACVGLGYLDDPDETARAFIANPFPELGCATLYRTGDLARMRANGVIECLGRIDDQIKIRGLRIEPGEIEAALQRHPDVKAAVVWAEGGASDARLVAGIVAAPACATTDATGLRSFLLRELPGHLVPDMFRQLESLPVMPGGKVDRKAAAQNAVALLPEKRRRHDPPQGAFEERLASLCKEILGCPDIGRHDNFFLDLGGDSLQAMRLVALLEERLAFKAELNLVFEASDLKDMAEKLGGTMGGAGALGLLSVQRRYLASWRGWKRSADGLLFAQNRDGTRQPLFWCFQGHQEHLRLSSSIGTDQPLVGMRSGHLIMDYTEQQVAELAGAYAKEIDLCQPAGPIFVGGNCQGSIIAEAAARHLQEMGRHVGCLIMLEATSFKPYGGKVALLFGRESHLNPFNREGDPLQLFAQVYAGGFGTDLVPGAHGEFFEPRNVQGLASALRRLVGEAGAAERPMLDMSLLV